MKIYKINYDNPKIEEIDSILECLDNGGVIVAPSDTCYGLICDIQNEKAVEKVYKIKQRSHDLPLSIAINHTLIDKYTSLSDLQKKSISKYLPGRYTLILDKSEKVPVFVNNSMNSVGVRIMECPIMEMIIKKFNKAIITTSANISGNAVKYDVSSLLEGLDNELLDLVLDAGILAENSPSKIVVVSKDGSESVLRQG